MDKLTNRVDFLPAVDLRQMITIPAAVYANRWV
jgi:hypothetical protein